MKIKLSYLPEEEASAAAVKGALRRFFPGVKVRESDRCPPYKHTYMAIKIPAKPHKIGEKIDKAPPVDYNKGDKIGMSTAQ